MGIKFKKIRYKVSRPYQAEFFSAFWAGVIITTMTWLVLVSKDQVVKMIAIWSTIFILAVLSFTHVIVSTSEVFLGMLMGADITILAWFKKIFIPGVIGNLSGGILVDQMLKFKEEGIGLSLGISIGNKAMIREIDLLKYLEKDPATRVIAFYVEGFAKGEGRDFVLAASRCPKPVIVIKSGKTPGGSRAVSSHTASLAGDYEVFSQVLAQMGVEEARDELELISFCESLSCYQTPIEGKIGIITGSGGHGAMAVDVCSAHGLLVPGLETREQEKIREDLSRSIETIASLSNPIDLTGSAVEVDEDEDEDFVSTARHLSTIPEIDCVLMLLLPYLPGITSDLGARLSSIYQKEGKALIAYVPHVEKFRMLIEGFELNGVPVSHFIEAAVLMAEALRRCQPC